MVINAIKIKHQTLTSQPSVVYYSDIYSESIILNASEYSTVGYFLSLTSAAKLLSYVFSAFSEKKHAGNSSYFL